MSLINPRRNELDIERKRPTITDFFECRYTAGVSNLSINHNHGLKEIDEIGRFDGSLGIKIVAVKRSGRSKLILGNNVVFACRLGCYDFGKAVMKRFVVDGRRYNTATEPRIELSKLLRREQGNITTLHRYLFMTVKDFYLLLSTWLDYVKGNLISSNNIKTTGVPSKRENSGKNQDVKRVCKKSSSGTYK